MSKYDIHWELLALNSIVDKLKLAQEYHAHLAALEDELYNLVEGDHDPEDVFYSYKYVRNQWCKLNINSPISTDECLKNMTEVRDNRKDVYKKEKHEHEKEYEKKKAHEEEIQRRLDAPWKDKI